MHRTKVNHEQSRAHAETFRTPMWVWDGLLDQFSLVQGRVLDPSAGDGRLIQAIIRRGNTARHKMYDVRREEMKTWKKTGLRDALDGRAYIRDFLMAPPKPVYDTVVTNPPFSLAREFIEHGLRCVRPEGRVIILHRLNWLGTHKRSLWLKSMPLEQVVVISRRPVWEIDGRPDNRADTYEYCFLCFRHGWGKSPRLSWMV